MSGAPEARGRRLIQLLPGHHRHDAVGTEALVIERLMRAAGWGVRTYAQFVDPELQGRTRPIEEIETRDLEGCVALYHMCVCSPVSRVFAELPCPRVLRYHNVTPPHFFAPYDRGLEGICHKAIAEVHDLAGRVDLALAVSRFNSEGLDAAGYRSTRVLPYLFEPDSLGGPADAAMLRRLEGPPVVLFVGRLVPNKAPDDFIRAAAAHAASGPPPARFVLAGKKSASGAYAELLESLMEAAGLTENELLITDEINQSELIACFRSAALFLSLSRHEGFLVPLLESMFLGVPIAALARAAVPETLGGAGVLFNEESPAAVAGLVRDLLADETLRGHLAELGGQRWRHFSASRWGLVLDRILSGLLRE